MKPKLGWRIHVNRIDSNDEREDRVEWDDPLDLYRDHQPQLHCDLNNKENSWYKVYTFLRPSLGKRGTEAEMQIAGWDAESSCLAQLNL